MAVLEHLEIDLGKEPTRSADEAPGVSEEGDVRELTGSARMGMMKLFKKWRPTI